MQNPDASIDSILGANLKPTEYADNVAQTGSLLKHIAYDAAGVFFGTTGVVTGSTGVLQLKDYFDKMSFYPEVKAMAMQRASEINPDLAYQAAQYLDGILREATSGNVARTLVFGVASAAQMLLGLYLIYNATHPEKAEIESPQKQGQGSSYQ